MSSQEETLTHMYDAAQINQANSVIPHLVGPPGVGKTSDARRLAEAKGVGFHLFNLSRLSPMEVEGINMPHTTEEEMELQLLHHPMWKQLKEGDVVLADEFLRAFPEIYNAMLDIFTEREVAGFHLPWVFLIAASNSITTYDQALEDRLYHMPTPDIRTNKAEEEKRVKAFLKSVSMHPSMADTPAMAALVREEVAPTYAMLDKLGGRYATTKNSGALQRTQGHTGSSFRKLADLVRLRQFRNYPELGALVDANNSAVLKTSHYQYYIVVPGRRIETRVAGAIKRLVNDKTAFEKLSDAVQRNAWLNLHYIETDAVKLKPSNTEQAPTIDLGESNDPFFD